MTIKEGGAAQEYVEKVLQNTQQFLEDTLKENERLRAVALNLEN